MLFRSVIKLDIEIKQLTLLRLVISVVILIKEETQSQLGISLAGHSKDMEIQTPVQLLLVIKPVLGSKV